MRPGKFRSCQSAVPRQNLRAGNLHGTGAQRGQPLQLMLFDRLRLCPAMLGLGRGLPLSSAHLPVNAFWNQATRSRGSLRRDCDAVGSRGSGLPGFRMVLFSA
jgi:hypothetical protein